MEEDDSVDGIEYSSASYDSFRTSLILTKIYDHAYEKEKYVLKEYQLIDHLIDMTAMKYSKKINTFIELLQAYNEEKEQRRIQTKDGGNTFITIFAFSIKVYSFQIREIEYIYKLILATSKQGVKQLQQYFRIRKQILRLAFSDPRNQTLFLDGISLSFEEWSGLVCKILGSDAIVAVGEKIRSFNQKCNRMNKVLQNSAEALLFIKICMKYLRLNNQQIFPQQQQYFFGNSKNNSTLEHLPSPLLASLGITNQKSSSQQSFSQLSQTYNRYSFQAAPKSSSNMSFTANLNPKLINPQPSSSSQSKSPVKELSYAQNYKASKRSTTPLSESTYRLKAMNETPSIFVCSDLENRLKSGKKKTFIDEDYENSQANPQAVQKGGIIIQNDLAFKYQDLAMFTKDLLVAVKRVILQVSTGGPLSQEEQTNLLNKSRYNGTILSDPFTLLKDSVSLASNNNPQKNQ